MSRPGFKASTVPTVVSTWNRIYRQQAEAGEWQRRDVRADTRWLDEFLPLFKAGANRRVLDLGCGPGQEVKRMALEGFIPFGLDAAEAGLDVACRLCPEAGFVRAGISRGLPFRDEAFGVVLSRFVIHRFTEDVTRRVISEVRRVLCPKGQFLFLVNSTRHRQAGIQYDYDGAEEIEPNLVRFRDGTMFRFFDETALADFFAAWDLRVCREVDMDQYGIRKLAWLVLAEKPR